MLRQSFRTLERAPRVRGRLCTGKGVLLSPVHQRGKIASKKKTTVKHDKLIALEIGICFFMTLIFKILLM